MKPEGQPNLMHQQILGELVANRMTTRTEVHYKRGAPVSVDIPTPTLAGNVSNFNCDLAALKWATKGKK